MAIHQKFTAAQERAFAAFAEKVGAKPFRRQDLATEMYRHTTPRSRTAADKMAEAFMLRLRASNQLVKAGHVHWKMVVATERTLLSGRVVPEVPEVMELTLSTRCPQKWLSVDLETGQVWEGSADGWKKVSDPARADLVSIFSIDG